MSRTWSSAPAGVLALPGNECVDDGDRVAVRQERVDDVRADESRATCYDRPHGRILRRRRMRPMFVTFEGLDGSGRPTQAELLVERLEADGEDVVAARASRAGRSSGRGSATWCCTGVTSLRGRKLSCTRRRAPARGRGDQARARAGARRSSATATSTRRSPTKVSRGDSGSKGCSTSTSPPWAVSFPIARSCSLDIAQLPRPPPPRATAWSASPTTFTRSRALATGSSQRFPRAHRRPRRDAPGREDRGGGVWSLRVRS